MNLINCDKQPNIPSGFTLESHQKGGTLKWDASKIELYLSEKQKTGHITGYDLRKELEGKPVLNACVLDYLLEHQELIPNEWKGKEVYFLGTIFHNMNGSPYIEYLYWEGDGWEWDYVWLGAYWGSYRPAALLASMPSETRNLGTPPDPLLSRIEALESDMANIKRFLNT